MRECTIADLAAAHADGAIVVDVREREEYAQGHVPGAILIPTGEVAVRMNDIPKDAGRVFVICATGNRSRGSADQLESAGYDACSVRGGTMGWAKAGHPLVTGMSPS